VNWVERGVAGREHITISPDGLPDVHGFGFVWQLFEHFSGCRKGLDLPTAKAHL
jgi:hypothetical protein